MGGLRVIPNKPDPSYVWELLRADTGELFLHFNVSRGLPRISGQKESLLLAPGRFCVHSPCNYRCP